MIFLALDIGGTKTSGAVFSRDGEMVDMLVVGSKSFDGQDRVYQNSKMALDRLMEKNNLRIGDVAAVGVGAPGPLDSKKGIIINAPLMGWYDFNLIERLAADFPVPAFLDNDANLGALAEQRRGLASGKQNIGYMTISTGIGGGLVLSGEVYRGGSDGAGEFGHMSMDHEGPACPCGNRGCLELYASGTAIGERVKRDRANGADSAVFGLSPAPTCRDLADAAANGDQYALDVFADAGHYLGAGIANILNLLNLEILVIGGGVTKARRFFEAAMYECAQRRCIQKFNRDQIKFSEMNDTVVLYGAYHLAAEAVNTVNK